MGKEYVNIKTVEFNDFSGGLHSVKLSKLLKDEESGDCQNVVWYDGALQMIPGLVRYGHQIGGSGGSKKINGIMDFTLRNTTQYIVVTSSDDVLYWHSTNQVWTSIDHGTTVIDDNKFQFIVMNDKIIGTNGSKDPFGWNGTDATVTTLSSFGTGDWVAGDTAKWITTFHDRAVMANVSITGGTVNLPCSVLLSDVEDPTGWDTANQEWNFDTDDGQGITGVKQLGEKLLVFKPTSIGYMTGHGLTSWTINPNWIQSVGCISGYTIKSGHVIVEGVYREVVIFLATGGLRGIDEAGNIYDLPMPEENAEYKCQEYFDTMDKTAFSSAVGAFDLKRNWYYSFYQASDGSQNDRGCIYDYSENALWPLVDLDVNCAAEVYDSTTGEYLIYVGTNDGIIHYLSETSKGVPTTTELISDGDMEDNTAPDPKNWTDYGSPTSSARDNTQALTQTYSCKIVTGANEGVGVYQDITTEIGKRYRVWGSCYIDTSGDFILAKEDTDGSNAVAATTVTTADKWQHTSLTFTATATTSRIKCTNDTTNCTLYVDDISAREIEVNSYHWTKHYDLGSESQVKFLRELVPIVEASDSGELTITVKYDKGAGVETTDTISMTSGQLDWATTIDWAAEIDWDSYEELYAEVQDLLQDSFRTVAFKIENNIGSSDMKFNRMLLSAVILGEWFFYTN